MERLGQGLPEEVRPDSVTPGPLGSVRPTTLVPGLAMICDRPHGQGLRLTVGALSVADGVAS